MMRVSSGRRIAPKVLSGKRAVAPAASVSSIVRSIGMVSGAGFGGFGVFGFGGGFFALALSLFVLSRAVESFGAERGPGFASVGAIRKEIEPSRRTDQLLASVSGRVIVYAAGVPIFVVSGPAMRLF